MANKSLLVRIGAQIKGLESGLAKAGKLTQSYGKSVAKVGAVGAAVAAGGLALFTAGTVKATRAAMQYDNALVQMRSALRAAGTKDLPGMTAALAAQADELQFLSRFTDDEILNAQALGLTMGLTTDQIGKATQVAADLAQATGKDLNTSIRYVIRSGREGATVLRRYGIELDDAALKAGGVDNAIEQLGDKLAGRAADAALTFTGRVENINKAWANNLEATGQAITRNETVNATLQVGTEVLRESGKWIEDNRETIGRWVDGGFAYAVDAINLTITGLEYGGKALMAFKVVGNLAIAGVIDIFEALVRSQAKALEGLETLARWQKLDSLANGIQGVRMRVSGFADDIERTGDVFRQTAQDGVDGFEKVGAWTQKARDRVADFETRVYAAKEGIKVLGSDATGQIAPVADGFDKASKKAAELTTKTNETTAATDRLGEEMVRAFGTGFEAWVSGTESAKDAFKGFASDALSIIERIAIEQITAASAAAAAEGAKSQAGIPVVGPILAPLAFAAMFALGRSALTKLHEGTDYVRRADLLRLPGMRPDEGIATLRVGEGVTKDGGGSGTTIVNHFHTNTIGFPSRAQERVYMNYALIPALKRSLT